MTKNHELFRFEGLLKEGRNKIQLKGRRITSKSEFYSKPLFSSRLDTYKSKCELDEEEIILNLEDFRVKMFRIPCLEEDVFVFSPIRHTYNL